MNDNIFIADSYFIYYIENNKLIFFPVIFGIFSGNFIKIFNLEILKSIIYIETLILTLIKSFINYFIFNYSKVYIYFFDLSGSIGYVLIKYLNILKLNFDIVVQNGIIYSIIINFNTKIIHIKNFSLVLSYSLGDAVYLFNKFYLKLYLKNLIFTIDLLNFYKNMLTLFIINRLYIIFELFINYNYSINILFNLNIYNILTLPGMSTLIYFKNYFKYKFEPLSIIQDNYIRRSFFGGINDIYIPHGLDVVMLDFNGMYPYIMRNTKFPIDTPYFIDTIVDLQTFCSQNSAFIYVDIFCKDTLNLPLIMFNYNNSVIQPVGFFSQIVWSKEILFCLVNYSEYYEFKVISALCFNNVEYIFDTFIFDLFIKKLKYKDLTNFFKLFMNSVYGHFGMNYNLNYAEIINKNDEFVFINNDNIAVTQTSVLNKYSSLVNYTKNIEIDLLYKLKLRIDWASIITSEARILIQQLKDLVPIYYIDTDSLIISSKHLSKLLHYVDNLSLGALKIVGYFDECIFLTTKIYLLRNGLNFFINFKGLSQELLTLSDDELFLLFKFGLSNGINLLNNVNLINYLSKYSYTFLFLYTKRLKIYNDLVWIKTKPRKLKKIIK